MRSLVDLYYLELGALLLTMSCNRCISAVTCCCGCMYVVLQNNLRTVSQKRQELPGHTIPYHGISKRGTLEEESISGSKF